MEQKKRGRKPKNVEPEAVQTSKPPTIHFTGCGWCDELNRSYYSGYYQPENWQEFDILKKYGDECK